LFSYYLSPHPPTSTLFPYTTLFRSSPKHTRCAKDWPLLAERLRDAAHRVPWGLRCKSLRLPVSTYLPRMESFGSSTASRQTIPRSEEHTSELQSQSNLVCRLLLEKK